LTLPARKARVAYVRGSYLNPFEAQYLEPLRELYDLTVAHPRSHRFDVSSISLPRRELPCLDYANGLIPRTIGSMRIPNPQKYLGIDEYLFGLDRFLPGFDLLHVAEQSFYSTYQIAMRKRHYGFRMITLQDEINPYWYDRSKGALARAQRVREHTDLFIARTERARCALLCEGVAPERIRVIGHGVDTTRFSPGPRPESLARSLAIEPDHLVVLLVGRLVWEKGIFALADAARMLLSGLPRNGPKPLFVIVGAGEELGRLQRRLDLLDVSRHFRLLGSLPYDQLPEMHRLADIFVLPSISTRYVLEQFGIALIEAMATGKPIVSTRCGAIDEVIGDSGLLVQPNDYYSLCEALRSLLQDASLRQRLGQLALRRVQSRFRSDQISAMISDAYRDVLILPAIFPTAAIAHAQ
jgi:glycosyltransferase involved in cell wall biosynthesis